MADPVRKPLISGNWKMFLNHFEAIQTIQKTYWALKPEDYRATEVSVHPPFTDIRSVQTVLEADSIPIALGAQNCHWEDTGSYSGEVSPAMLTKLNVTYVIVGHSERRAHFGETDEMVAKKAQAVFRNGMKPIVCVGETTEEREEGIADDVVRNQVLAGLSKVKKDDLSKVVVAYEPRWAIGSGKPASPEDAQYIAKGIRTVIAQKWGGDIADQIRIQYGGSVVGANARSYMECSDVDGLLIGKPSRDPEDFARIVAATH